MNLPKIVYVYFDRYSYGHDIRGVVTDCTSLEDGTIVGIYELKDKAKVRTEVSLEDI